MNKSVILGVSILWAAAILATAMLVKGTPHADSVILLLSVCASTSTLLMGSACRKSRERASA